MRIEMPSIADLQRVLEPTKHDRGIPAPVSDGLGEPSYLWATMASGGFLHYWWKLAGRLADQSQVTTGPRALENVLLSPELRALVGHMAVPPQGGVSLLFQPSRWKPTPASLEGFGLRPRKPLVKAPPPAALPRWDVLRFGGGRAVIIPVKKFHLFRSDLRGASLLWIERRKFALAPDGWSHRAIDEEFMVGRDDNYEEILAGGRAFPPDILETRDGITYNTLVNLTLAVIAPESPTARDLPDASVNVEIIGVGFHRETREPMGITLGYSDYPTFLLRHGKIMELILQLVRKPG